MMSFYKNYLKRKLHGFYICIIYYSLISLKSVEFGGKFDLYIVINFHTNHEKTLLNVWCIFRTDFILLQFLYFFLQPQELAPCQEDNNLYVV